MFALSGRRLLLLIRQPRIIVFTKERFDGFGVHSVYPQQALVLGILVLGSARGSEGWSRVCAFVGEG